MTFLLPTFFDVTILWGTNPIIPVPLMCIVYQSHTVGLVCEKLSLGFLLGWLLRKAIFTRQSKFFIQFTPKSIFFVLFCFCFVVFFSFVAFYLYLILLFAEVTGLNPVEALIIFSGFFFPIA